MGSDDEGGEEAKAGLRSRWKRWLVRIVAGLVLLGAAGWMAVNVLLNLSWTKSAIEKKAVRMVDAPVEVGRILAMPWGTLRLIDIRMTVPEGTEIREDFPPLVSCGEIRIRVEPFSLLTRHIRLTRFEVIDPVLSVVRSGTSGLILPKRVGSDDLDWEEARRGIDDLSRSTVSPSASSPTFVMPETATDDVVSSESLLADLSEEGGIDVDSIVAPVGDGQENVANDTSGVEAPASSEVKGGSANRPKDKVVPTEGTEHPIVIRFRGRDFHFGKMVLQRGLMQVISLEEGEVLLGVEDLEMSVDLGKGDLKPGSLRAGKNYFFRFDNGNRPTGRCDFKWSLVRFFERNG